MSEKLTKTAIKDELTRRIEWFEDNYGFHIGNNVIQEMSVNTAIMYGRYLTLTDIKQQIERNLFIGGFAC